MRSLRRAILFWMALLLLVVGVVSSAVTYEYVKDETQSSFDAEIRQIAQFLQNEAAGSAAPSEALAAPNPDNLFLIQIWNQHGTLLRSSDKTASATAPESTGFSTQDLGHGEWRSYSIVGPQQIIRVGLPLDERNEQASTAALQIAIPMAIIIPLSWLLLSLLIDRILVGLDRASTQVRNRKIDDQSQIPISGVPQEITPFVQSINAHVLRVQAGAEKQKRFLSDAAHELRTPLTALSIQLENLKTVLKTKDQRDRLAAAIGGSKRANQLVSRLLELARHDAHHAPADGKQESLNNILGQVSADLGPQASQRSIAIKIDSQPGPDGFLPLPEFSQVCEILLENAIRYSPRNSTIFIKTFHGEQEFEVRIIDHGPGIDPTKLPLVFDRFYRADPHTSEGTGLGLSIAKAICERRGWSLSLKNRGGRTGIEAIISGKFSAS